MARCDGKTTVNTGHASTGYGWTRQCKNQAVGQTVKGHNVCASHKKAMRGFGAQFVDGTVEYQ